MSPRLVIASCAITLLVGRLALADQLPTNSHLVVNKAVGTASNVEVPPITFAGIAWGTSGPVGKASLAAAGFVFDSTDKDGDLNFHGTLEGYPTHLILLMADGKSAKVFINILTPDPKAREVYGDLKEALTSKYGHPSTGIEHFSDPYYDGDGYEDQAIRLDKAKFMQLWTRPTPAGDEGLVLQVTDALTVQCAYESAGWAKEADRRKAKANAVF